MKDIYKAITLAQSVYKCDYLDFDDAFRIAYPQVFKKINWYDKYLSAVFNIRVKTDLDPGGIMDYQQPAQP